MSDKVLEPLEKAGCVRCGKPNMGGTKGGRCRACMSKLTRKRQTPGSKERSWQHADQALRREQGRSGTSTGGHKSGHGKRQEIQRKMRNAEKKTGQKLSADRIDNEKGYKSSNVRAVPEKLNVGRHHVDKKKLAAWRKRLKKSNISENEFMMMLITKIQQSPLMEKLVDSSSESLNKFESLITWQQKLAKNDLSLEELKTLLLAKATDEQLFEIISDSNILSILEDI